MKVETSRINKVELVTKPDGKYWRIELSPNPGMTEKARQHAVKLWASPMGRTALTSAVTAAATAIFLKLVGL